MDRLVHRRGGSSWTAGPVDHTANYGQAGVAGGVARRPDLADY
jgi:hypothetical protein